MKKHATSIKGFDSLNEAAQEIGKMRYDALAAFLMNLTMEMERQRKNDIAAGKPKLAASHSMLLHHLIEASGEAQEMFDKYKKYMKDEIDDK